MIKSFNYGFETVSFNMVILSRILFFTLRSNYRRKTTDENDKDPHSPRHFLWDSKLSLVWDYKNLSREGRYEKNGSRASPKWWFRGICRWSWNYSTWLQEDPLEIYEDYISRKNVNSQVYFCKFIWKEVIFDFSRSKFKMISSWKYSANLRMNSMLKINLLKSELKFLSGTTDWSEINWVINQMILNFRYPIFSASKTLRDI